MASADDGGNAMFTENMPAPPPFWRFFTKENMEQVEKLKENNESIPSDLSALIPPQIPDDGKYRSFGGSFNVIALPARLFMHMLILTAISTPAISRRTTARTIVSSISHCRDK